LFIFCQKRFNIVLPPSNIIRIPAKIKGIKKSKCNSNEFFKKLRYCYNYFFKNIATIIDIITHKYKICLCCPIVLIRVFFILMKCISGISLIFLNFLFYFFVFIFIYIIFAIKKKRIFCQDITNACWILKEFILRQICMVLLISTQKILVKDTIKILL
jgi:hypothetical protein